MYEYRVLEVKRVIDADTFDVVISLGFGLRAAFRFRLTGVDAPEMYGVNASEAGRECRDFVESWLNQRKGALRAITEKSSDSTVGIGDGAFGRWQADIIDVGGSSLAEAVRGWMRERGS